ncbi:MAG: protein kinase [archaeon]|nr:protein kinase [archaeon]
MEGNDYSQSPQNASGADIECKNEDFYQKEDELIFLGKLGCATRVVHKKSKVPYLIVNFQKSAIVNPEVKKKINSTISLMYKIKNPFMIRILNHYEDENNLYLIIQNSSYESLQSKIEKAESMEELLFYFKQICEAISYLQKNFNIKNLNIYPENIVIDNNTIKLTDFGIKIGGPNPKEKPLRPIKVMVRGNKKIPITAYTNPEEINSMINKTRVIYSEKSDSWNLGILLYEMCLKFKGPSIFPCSTLDEMAKAILEGKPNLNGVKDSFCKALISKLIKPKADQRLSVGDILNIEEIKNIDLSSIDYEYKEIIINNFPEEAEENKGEEEEEGEEEEDEDPLEKIRKMKDMDDEEFENEKALTEDELNQKEKNLDLLLSQMGEDGEEEKKEEENEGEEEEDEDPLEKIRKMKDMGDEEFENEKALTEDELNQKEKNLDLLLSQMGGDGEEGEANEEENKEGQNEEGEECCTDEESLKQIREAIENLKEKQNEFSEMMNNLIQTSQSIETKLLKSKDKLINDFDNKLNPLLDNLIEHYSKEETEKEENKIEEEANKKRKEYEEKIKNMEDTISQLKTKISQMKIDIVSLTENKTNLENVLGKSKVFLTENFTDEQFEKFFDNFNLFK